MPPRQQNPSTNSNSALAPTSTPARPAPVTEPKQTPQMKDLATLDMPPPIPPHPLWPVHPPLTTSTLQRTATNTFTTDPTRPSHSPLFHPPALSTHHNPDLIHIDSHASTLHAIPPPFNQLLLSLSHHWQAISTQQPPWQGNPELSRHGLHDNHE